MGCIHIAGIGGVGMSALAQALLDQGHRVTGSDRLLDHGDLTPILRCLKGQGVQFSPQDGSGVTEETAQLVISSAIEEDNPELVKAHALGVEVVHRAKALARAMSGHQLIAVAGTCGKSTVTALLGHLLAEAGEDPQVVNGAEVVGWGRNGARMGSVRSGSGKWAVVEVDESDKSLMAFDPAHAIITNASADHFGLAEAESLFADFRDKVPGVVIDGREGVKAPQDIDLTGWRGSFTWEGVRYAVPMPGYHNVLNSWYAVRMALALGCDAERLAAGLACFPGVIRRLQKVGHCGDATVIDDYAHNPQKLSAAWETLAAAFPKGICAAWRPHGYGPLRKMGDALAEMFAKVCRPQDRLLILPVYDAGGTANRTVHSDQLVQKLEGKINVSLVPDLELAETEMRAASKEIGALVTFGARDPGLPRLAAALCREE